MLNRTNVILAVALVAVILMTVMSRVDLSRPNIEILPDMKYSPASMAYSTNTVFPNGRTLQAPVSGTVARGQLPWHFEATEEDAIRAGEEFVNPYSVNDTENESAEEVANEVANEVADDAAEEKPDAAELLRQSVQRGGETYRVFCVSCHGATGAGDGPVPKRGFPPPPSLHTGKSPQMKDGQLFHILTYGQGSMAGFAGQLPREQRWDVINYVRSLQKKE